MNIWNKIYSFFYSIPFGMKAAEDEVMLSKVDASSVDTGIHQQISQQRVGQDLLKGEVTQEVEELRYRDYKVYRESKHYKPIGDEMVKVENIKNDIFHQCNEFICHGTDGNEDDQFRIKIEYEYLSRFKIEKCIQSVSVNMNPSKMEIVLNVQKNLIVKDGM